MLLKSTREKIAKCATNIIRLIFLLKYKELEAKIRPYTGNGDDYHAAETWIEKHLAINSKRLTLINKLKKRERLQELLDTLPEVQKLGDKCPPPHVYEELKGGIRKRSKALTKAIEIKQRLEKLGLDKQFQSIEEAKEQQKKLEYKLEHYRPLIDKAQTILSNTTGKLSVLEVVSNDINRLQTRLNELQVKTKNLKIYEALRKAFGPKGLRKQKTVFFASKLQNNLNKYASLIFGESITFKINVSNTRLDILAERGGNIDDVRSLSGAESSCFTLLLIICILPFIKSSDRFNMVVLDELETGLDAPSKVLFVEKYLPILQQIVPHVFIVSPLSEEEFYLPNAHHITIRKKNRVSEIVENT